MAELIKQINRLLKQEKNPPRYKKNPLIYPYINLLFVELIKLVIISIRVYKDMPQGKLVVNFRNFTWSRA